jgi:hypothetical protein
MKKERGYFQSEALSARNLILGASMQKETEKAVEAAGFGVGTAFCGQPAEVFFQFLRDTNWLVENNYWQRKGITNVVLNSEVRNMLISHHFDPKTRASMGSFQFLRQGERDGKEYAYWAVEEGWERTPVMHEWIWDKIGEDLAHADTEQKAKCLWWVWKIYLDYICEIEDLAREGPVVVLLDEMDEEERERFEQMEEFSLDKLLKIVGEENEPSRTKLLGS